MSLRSDVRQFSLAAVTISVIEGTMNLVKLALFLSLFLLPSAATAAEISSEKLSSGNVVISIRGDIVLGDDVRFRKLSLQNPTAIVRLNSNGGVLVSALEIGQIIRIAGYDTAVLGTETCVSACALIWMAGKRRVLGGAIGFHAAYRDDRGAPQESGAANALVGNYLTLLGFSSRAILFATAAPPDKVLWLTQANKEAAGIDFIVPVSAPKITTMGSAPSSEGSSVPPPIFTPSRVVSPVTIKSSNVRDAEGTKLVSYEFKYLGLLLNRLLIDPEDAGKELQELVDTQISEGDGWVTYGFSGSFEQKNSTTYAIHFPTMQSKGSFLEVWVKEDHEFNSKVKHRSEVVFYRVFCKERSYALLELSKFDAGGNSLESRTFGEFRQRVMPGRMDEVLWKTVCS